MRESMNGEGRPASRSGAAFWEAVYVIAILFAAIGGVFVYRASVLSFENDTALIIHNQHLQVIEAALVREGLLSLADVEPKAAMAGPQRPPQGRPVQPDLVLEGEPVTPHNGSTVQRIGDD